MGFPDEVRRKLDEIKAREASIWGAFLSHSRDYMDALRLSLEDLEVLERAKERGSIYPDVAEHGARGFLQVEVEGESFSLTVSHICGLHYGGSWQTLLFSVCLSNPELNESVGGGTTLITVVPEEWHRKILSRLSEGSEANIPMWLPDDLREHWE